MSEKNAVLSVKSLLAQDKYKNRFNEVLGNNAPQFMASVVQASQSQALVNCQPESIIASAFTGATLNLPVDKNLGFAHLVPYGGKATFQIGYKGFIQLGLRSGQYKQMNAVAINAEAFGGYDEVGDPIIDWAKFDDSKEAVGYVFAWKLVNGFTKVIYWSKERVIAHATRFSQAFRAKKKDSPWFTDFDTMALKTVAKHGLSRWGILSVEMVNAMRFDQTVREDIDSDPEPSPETIDIESEQVNPVPDKAAAAAPPTRPRQTRQARPAPTAQVARDPEPVTPPPQTEPEPEPTQEPQTEPEPEPTREPETDGTEAAPPDDAPPEGEDGDGQDWVPNFDEPLASIEEIRAQIPFTDGQFCAFMRSRGKASASHTAIKQFAKSTLVEYLRKWKEWTPLILKFKSA